MSFMDQIKEKASSFAAEHAGNAAIAMAASHLLDHAGGLQGLVSMFEQKGLGSVIQSWIGSGQNMPISVNQIESVIGNDKINAISQKLGMSPEDLQQKLASHLPQLINALTPHGTITENQVSLTSLMNAAKSINTTSAPAEKGMTT